MHSSSIKTLTYQLPCHVRQTDMSGHVSKDLSRAYEAGHVGRERKMCQECDYLDILV